MGLLHSLVNWGIRIVDNTETDIHRIGKRLGYMPLSWRQVVMQNPAKEGLLWRVPDPDVVMANSLAHVQALLVANYEQVMVFRNGVLLGGESVTLPPGLYDFGRVQARDHLEFVWTTSREFHLRWGVANVLTKDRISIGAHGHYRAAIADPAAFLLNLASHAQVYKENDLEAFAKGEVAAVLRDLIARLTVMELQLARSELLYACQERLQPIFERWGLELRGLTIEGESIPEQFLQAAAGSTIVSLDKAAQLEAAKADVILAQLKAQEALYLTQAEANNRLSLGRVEVELMQEQQRSGIDPLEIKRIEAIETVAANPGQGTLIDARPQIVSQIVAQPSAPSVGPLTVTGSLVPPHAAPSLLSGAHTNDALTGGVSPAGPTSAESRQKLQEMLDKLDERLIAGEITEQKHSELYERLQKKLRELP